MDDYKEKYKQAVKKIKDLFNEGEQKGFTIITYRKDFEKIFPELKEEPEDERIRKELIRVFSNREKYRIAQSFGDITVSEALTWLKKQGKKETKEASIWKHWKDGVAGNGDGEPIYLIKNGYCYSLSSCLWYECDYILLSDLDKLRQGELKPISFDDSAMIDSCLTWSEEDERNLQGIIDEIEANKNQAPDYDLATYDRFLSWLKSLKERIGGKL